MKFGLLIIDLQKAWYNDQTRESIDRSCEYINALIPAFKEKNYPVIYIQHISKGGGVIPGAESFEMVDALKPDDTDPIVHKTYGNSFNKTNLKSLVEATGIETWILAGYRAENCVLSTYRGALDLDLTPILLKNAIAGPLQDRVKFVEDISDTISFNVLVKLLKE